MKNFTPPVLLQATFVFLVLIANFPSPTDTKGQYVMPLLGGMKMSVAYDIANLFIRPIAASISTFLSICLLFILFFGVITSPFGKAHSFRLYRLIQYVFWAKFLKYFASYPTRLRFWNTLKEIRSWWNRGPSSSRPGTIVKKYWFWVLECDKSHLYIEQDRQLPAEHSHFWRTSIFLAPTNYS